MSSDLVLFVHGLGGNAQSTWGRFPELLRSDEELQHIDVGFFSYPTSLFRLPFSRKAPRIQTLAQGLRTQIEYQFQKYDRITLASHSLGGLIARKYLLEEVKRGNELRVDRLVLYAVPNSGTDLASIANQISWRHGQLAQLCRTSDLIEELSKDWHTFKMTDALFVRYVVAALDEVVSRESAHGFWGNPAIDVMIDRGHRDIVKPANRDDLAFLILKDVLLRGRPDTVAADVATASRPAVTELRGEARPPVELEKPRYEPTAQQPKQLTHERTGVPWYRKSKVQAAIVAGVFALLITAMIALSNGSGIEVTTHGNQSPAVVTKGNVIINPEKEASK